MATGEREKSIDIDVGFYDPFSIFQGGLRTDFEKYVKIKSFYWKDFKETLRILKNITFKYIEEIPRSDSQNGVVYLKFMFVCCNNIDDYRSKIRPLIVQWLNSLEEQSPKLPHFIFLFENSELRTTTDKFLKTNILNKLKLDFPAVPNIYKIKSLFHSEEDRDETWRLISNATRAVLSDAINLQLLRFREDKSKIAEIYNSLNQKDDALSCFSHLFNSIIYIKKHEFSNFETDGFLRTIQKDECLQVPKNNFIKKTLFLRKQEEILLDESLSDNAYARNAGKYAQIIFTYINSLEMCYRRNEIAYLIITNFFAKARLKTMMDSQKIDALDVIVTLSNLKLLLRNELIALGTSKSYILKGSLSVIDLQFEKEEYNIFSTELQHLMESQKTFVGTIIYYTRELIETYNVKNVNMGSLAILTTELALILFYSADEYETSSEQLAKSYEFFLTNGWKYIGVTLLEIYIQNLEKLISTHGNQVILQLISSYLALAMNDENNLDGNKFTDLCLKLEKPFTMEGNDIFSIQSISRVYCKEVDVYCVDIVLLSNITVVADSIQLTLTNNSKKTEFSSPYVKLQKSNVVTLFCNEISCGNFEIESLRFNVGNLHLEKKCHGSLNIEVIHSFVSENNEILKNTSTSIYVPKVRDLNSEFLKMQLQIGNNSIKHIEFFFLDNLNNILINENSEILMTELTNSENALRMEVTKEQNRLKLACLENVILQAHNTYEISIPCFLSASNPKIFLTYEFKFYSIKNNNEDIGCSHKIYHVADTTLPLAVAANEIFKSTTPRDNDMLPKFFFLSQYTINSVSSENPVRIHNVTLLGNKSLIETWKPQKNIVAFVDQGTTFFYKISGFKDESVLLKIEYSTMSDETLVLINKLFWKFLSELDSVDLRMKLRFINAAKVLWNGVKFKYNFYALTFKIQLAERLEKHFDSVSNYLDPKERELFSTIIVDFISSVEKYEIDDATKSDLLKDTKNELQIVVDIPDINMVTTVEYKFDRKLQYKEAVPVLVCLNVFFVPFDKENNDKESAQRKVTFEGKNESVHIEINFIDNEQKWIVAGIKSLDLSVDLEKASCPSGQSFEFDLTFIPLKVGKIQLPSIEIKNKSSKKYSMEIDYKNTTESVLVVSELNKVIHSF